MAVIVGRGASLGMGKESTWGTAVARSNWINVASVESLRQIDKQVVPVLNIAGAAHRDFFIGSDNAGVRVSTFPTYENFGMLLEAMMGGLATTGPSGSDYTHTYTLAADQPKGLTLEVVQGTAANSIVHEGCRVSRGRLSVEAGGLLSMDADFMSETHAAPASAATPSLAAGQSYVAGHHFGQFGFNSNNLDVASFEVEVNNGTTRYPVVGSKLTQELSRGIVEVTGRVTVRFVDHTQFNEFTADTQGDATFTATSGSLSMAFVMQNMIWTEVGDPISDHGHFMQTLSFRCFGDGTNNGLSIAVVNTSSSGTAN